MKSAVAVAVIPPRTTLSAEVLQPTTCCHSVVAHEYYSECPYYFRDVDAAQANRLLAAETPGTFLLRPSSSPSCPCTLSVSTARGPTSIRIMTMRTAATADGRCTTRVQLDCDGHQKAVMPSFETPFDLVRHYSQLGKTDKEFRYYFVLFVRVY